MDTSRNIVVDIERNRVRIVISHGEDEEIIKLSIAEARDLLSKVADTVEDYEQRKQVRID
ncbi:hypothetical protein [Methanococcoides methylutens]|uniref:Uncharacterized protein n=1 Tax=Methanococcoides methylutens MM1 TaxID=1434104 RepID=A0A0E3SNM4_METMT|nr:hypothetical protein [Methanococcoides methylutens]AKB84161.1 hypothetical protein MCMEM_0108 [Methanococcoides methylutens MM1]